MTPAEIAAKLTPAQIAALRDPQTCSALDGLSLIHFEQVAGIALLNDRVTAVTPLGRAVMAELEGK